MASRRLLPLLVFAAAVLPFLAALGNGFVNWDDQVALTGNPAFRGLGPAQLRWMFTTFLLGHYQPLAWVSYGLDYLLWGLDPYGYHLTSALLHGLNAVLLYALVVELLRRAAGAARARDEDLAGAAFAALLFALHPLRVESVAWATERRDVLSGAFYLGALLSYARKPGARPATLALAAGALLTKVTSLTLPLALLILDYYPLRRRALAEKAPFAALSLAAVALGFAAQGPSGALVPLAELGAGARLHRALFGLGFYLWKSVLPAGLAPWYGQSFLDARPWVAPLGLLALAVPVWAASAGRRGWAAAWGFYLAAVFPMLGLIQSGRQVAADRFSYLPLAGLAALAGAGLSRLLQRRPRWSAAALAGAAALLLALGRGAAAQTAAWRDTGSLWRQVAAADPDSPELKVNAGFGLIEQGRYAEAADYYARLRAEHPGLAGAAAAESMARNNLALTLASHGRLADAVRELERALPDSPRPAAIHENLGVLLVRLGRRGEAARHFAAARGVRP